MAGRQFGITAPCPTSITNAYISLIPSFRGGQVYAFSGLSGSGSAVNVASSITVNYTWLSVGGFGGSGSVVLSSGNSQVFTGNLADPGDDIDSIVIDSISPSSDGSYNYIIDNY